MKADNICVSKSKQPKIQQNYRSEINSIKGNLILFLVRTTAFHQQKDTELQNLGNEHLLQETEVPLLLPGSEEKQPYLTISACIFKAKK